MERSGGDGASAVLVNGICLLLAFARVIKRESADHTVQTCFSLFLFIPPLDSGCGLTGQNSFLKKIIIITELSAFEGGFFCFSGPSAMLLSEPALKCLGQGSPVTHY